MHGRAAMVGLTLGSLVLGGCLSRRLEITSEPSGALVTLNDQELGITPLSASFTHYGSYDILLEKAGCDPLRTHRTAWTPWYEFPPLDLGVSALPIPVEHVTRWHFTLTPSLERTQDQATLEKGLLERARELAETARGDGPPGP